MKFCPQCNAQLDDDTKFCTTCGAPTADVPVYTDAQPEAQYAEPAQYSEPAQYGEQYAQPVQYAEQPQYTEPAHDPYAVSEMDSVVPPIITDETFAPTQNAYAQPYQ
ncbi:MAG: zinc-ribbon domain-containing protein, partial [Ruminococcus sp.]|nr:zinc-ribbon domain-containing protein [Ruminococcus sp.]